VELPWTSCEMRPVSNREVEGSMTPTDQDQASLEAVIESVELGLEVLHPGGLEITKELAELCHVGSDTRVLDVASGTGEAGCFLAETFQCQVIGLDASEAMVRRAQRKGAERGLNVEFERGDAERLPFAPGSFDVVVCECTVCYLDTEATIREMVRVARPGGYVGIHDLCWKERAPADLRRRLAEIEREQPETLRGWKELFERAGLVEVVALDRSQVIADWTKDFKRRLGVTGQFSVFFTVFRRWGLKGLRRIRESERIFRSEHMGYGILVGRKP
jgi:ubiquinone/menaquinone biosynthesis C-methylase UbiE